MGNVVGAHKKIKQRGGGGGRLVYKTCPPGEYITYIEGGIGDYVDRVCMECSDGSSLGCTADSIGGAKYKFDENPDGINKITMMADRYLRSINGKGRSMGTEFVDECPDGQVIVGYHANSGRITDGMGIICGKPLKDYCKLYPNKPGCKKLPMAGFMDMLKYMGNEKEPEWIGFYRGRRECPAGAYVSKFKIHASKDDWAVGSVEAHCSDGTSLGRAGGVGGGPIYNMYGPIKGWYGYADKEHNHIRALGYLDNQTPKRSFGKHIGDKFEQACPAGQVVVGYDAYASQDKWLRRLRPICSTVDRDYCTKFPDHEACAKVSQKKLNEICKIDMYHKLCQDRLNEVYDQTVSDFCANHPNDEFCSCFKKPSFTLPKEAKELPNCISRTCMEKGFKPGIAKYFNTSFDCPDISLQKNQLSNAEILDIADNVQLLD